MKWKSGGSQHSAELPSSSTSHHAGNSNNRQQRPQFEKKNTIRDGSVFALRLQSSCHKQCNTLNSQVLFGHVFQQLFG